MKTYFNYEGKISSKEIAEAIGFPSGMGPFMGFGSARINNNEITLLPNSQDTIYKDIIGDRNTARKLSMKGEATSPNFGLINRTGHIYISTESQISINIEGSKGSFNEVIVFAVFQYVEAAIEMVPTIKAFWNNGTSFYDFYKSSLNAGYNDLISDVQAPWTNTNYTYQSLISRVASSGLDWYTNTSTAILIGVYGTGTNSSGEIDSFAIVPYEGKFPQPLPFNPSYYTPLLQKLNGLSNWIFANVDTNKYPNLITLISGLIEGEIETPGLVPVGGIILWNTDKEIPDNYAICDGTRGTPDLRGRFIVGAGEEYKLGDSGGSKSTALTADNLPAHLHGVNDYYYANTHHNTVENGASYYDEVWINNGVGPTGNDRDNTYLVYYPHNTKLAGKENPDPVPTIPPYYTLIYLMRLK